MNATRLARCAVLALTLGAAFQACGGLDPANITIIDEQGDAGMTQSAGGNDGGGGDGSPTTAKGGEGAAPSDGGSAGDTPGVGGSDVGGAAPEGDCPTGDPCMIGPDAGLCLDGVCSTCHDPDDDTGCAAAYGDDHLCIDGGCVQAECRTDADCKGGTCINHACAPCQSDADCTAANTICNTTTGACVTNDSCGAAQNGEKCPVNPRDLCCGMGEKCEAVQCCGVAACFTDFTLKDPDGFCDKGLCVRANCGKPPATTRHVDFDALPGGNGSKDCPFSKLGPAVESLLNTGGTVLVQLGGTTELEHSLSVGPGTTITGADENWEPCTPMTCIGSGKWPKINTGNGRAFDMKSGGQRNLRYLQLVGESEANFKASTWSAVYVSAASLHVDHLDISGYQFGLYGDTAGSIASGGGLRVHHCRSGLYLEDGEASAGGSADIEVSQGDDPISFDHNTFGIVVHGNATFLLGGPPAGRGLTNLISANDNGGSGVYFPAHNAKPGLIVGLEAAKNGSDPDVGNHDGATVFAHAIVKIRDSYFHDNLGSGIHIPGNGPNTADGLSGIDLGKNIGNNAGHNTFINNGDAGICVEENPAKAATQNSLSAQGNIFRTAGGDCTADGTYIRADACDGSGADYAGACAGAADLTGCVPSNTCP